MLRGDVLSICLTNYRGCAHHGSAHHSRAYRREEPNGGPEFTDHRGAHTITVAGIGHHRMLARV